MMCNAQNSRNEWDSATTVGPQVNVNAGTSASIASSGIEFRWRQESRNGDYIPRNRGFVFLVYWTTAYPFMDYLAARADGLSRETDAT
jgi:hypothetical protein